MPQESKIDVSIIIPLFNEEMFLIKLYNQLFKYFNFKEAEIIFVNDGSTDKSLEILEKIQKEDYKFNFKIINLKKNYGKGKAIKNGINIASGKYIILQDADLELDVKDSKELYEIIKSDDQIQCIFGSRYLTGKLKKHNYFLNEFFGKINSFLFNILFGQSLSDIHCGLKIFSSEIAKKINISINDFGIEIDLASQIVKQKCHIYEFGVSYYSRTKLEGKKLNWIDGIKVYYYLFKVRFVDNPISIKLSILLSSAYMTFVGTYFGMGIGKTLFIICFFFIGLVIGLNTKIFSSSLIFLFIYVGSLFGNGQGKVLSVFLFFCLGTFIVSKLKKAFINKNLGFFSSLI